MSDERKTVPIEVVPGAEFVTASDHPVFGEKRLVRMLPVGLPGTKGMLMPCLWMSDYEVMDEDLKEKVKVCLVLMSKGPPRPDIICVRIATAAIEKFPLGPVEW